VYPATKWSWKRLAAKLLLVPVLAGGGVAAVQAQLGKSGSPAPAAPMMPTGTASKSKSAPPAAGADPKQLLKDARKALDEGRFGDATDLAQAAEANNPGGKWGLFGDTPASLRGDIAKAKAKADKAKSEQLVKEAKALVAKPGSDAERAYNLDTALQMARKADQLHGPYSTWDMGDRADKLIKDIEAARSKIKVAAAPKPPAPGGTAVASGTGTKPAAPFVAGADAKKAAAVKLIADGRACADRGDFAGAKAKYQEADKVGANWAAGEYAPGFALQELNTRGAAAMDTLVREAQTATAAKDYTKAEASLNAAGTIANTLGLFPKAVSEGKAALWTASAGKHGTAGGTVAAGGPETLVPVGGPNTTVAPGAPAGTQTVYAPKAGGTSLTARQLLDQASYELSRGEYETATKLAVQAHNQGAQADAAKLLNSIDAEKLAQKKRMAAASFANAKSAYEAKEYERASGVLVLIEANLLTDAQKGEREKMLEACRAAGAKADTGIVKIGGQEPTEPKVPTNPTNPPGTARVGGSDAKPADGVANQAAALRKVQYDKLRSEGLTVQENSLKAFGRGETDLAMQMMLDYSNRVRASGLEPGRVADLLRPIDSRLEQFRVMKGQIDATARLNKERKEARDQIAGRGIAEEERKREVAALVRQYHELVKVKGDYAAAERVALQAKQLDPDDPAVSALAEMARLTSRVKTAEKDKREKESFILGALNDNDRTGPLVTTDSPVNIQLRALERARGRGSLNDSYLKTRTQSEYEIEVKLDKPISVEFRQTPLDQAIKNVQTLTGLPLVIDYRGLTQEGVSEVQLVTFEPGAAMSAKNVLACVCEQAGVSYLVENDAVKITTVKKSKGRMVTKVFSVADLVTPVPNFALPEFANFDKMLMRNALNSGQAQISGLNAPGGGSTPFAPSGGLGGGVQTGNPQYGELATQPGVMTGRQGGTLQTSPLAASTNVTNANNSKHEQLMKLITSMVRPYSWDGQGGGGKVEFFDIGNALVVNQTADVVREVEDLLESLRRLQDLAVAIEIRIVTLAESFFERMGLDFSVNIKTNNTSFEPQLTGPTGTGPGTFRPTPFINDINSRATVGLTPAGSFTPDLDVPIRATSFNRAVPAFGNFPNNPGNNGGISLGLAFLNDIQVYTFMEMAQGDQRSNIMNAPKVTLFNGQTANLSVNQTEFYVTNVQVFSVNGQIVFIPQNTPLPGSPEGTLTITVQAVVSADRRFVRVNQDVTLAAQSGATVPLFPITTFVTPVFEGGSQGQPIPFTQFIQQPAFTSITVQTTVVCPDGGTVLMGGLKRLRESRNEFGPPFLSKIPYLNRLFKNVGVGRDSQHVMIMLTPRIIINSEEEIVQTEGRQAAP
jgi:type II secretory pathway component GspD/PulD (secretin)/tetratricopeptide (TPR) repeat protein